MANEVTVGFGRTGKWFGFQHYDYSPDIVAMGKALGNGYPVSGISISEDVSKRFNNNPFRYAQSHQNDPLGCAIGLEVIEIIESTALVQKSFEKGEYFKEELKKLQDKYTDKIRDIRGRGLMLALEFEESINMEDLSKQLLNGGFITGYKNHILRFMPPLIIQKEEIDALLKNVNSILSTHK